MDTSPVKDFLVTYLMPEKCYERIFVHFQLSVPCLTFILNRIVGVWIILDTFLALLPQLVKILRRRSSEGLSVTSALLQLHAFSCPVLYTVALNFPPAAWVDRLITLSQSTAMVFFILHYRGETLKGLLLLLAYGGVMFLLGSYAAIAVVSAMHDSSVAALIASKALQAGTNYKNGHTGQLSTLSVFLSWAGSLGVVFVSLQQTGSSCVTLCHTTSAGLSCVLLVQVLRSRSSADNTKKKSE